MKAALLIALFVATGSAAMADSTKHSLRRPGPPVTCDMVRAYVSQMGVGQARAMALAAGMTAAQERRARQCLADKI